MFFAQGNRMKVRVYSSLGHGFDPRTPTSSTGLNPGVLKTIPGVPQAPIVIPHPQAPALNLQPGWPSITEIPGPLEHHLETIINLRYCSRTLIGRIEI